MPLFLVITKSVDEDKEKESFDKVVKEIFLALKIFLFYLYLPEVAKEILHLV